MSDLVLKLALQAMSDEDALPVLHDAIRETGWVSSRWTQRRWRLDAGLVVALLAVDADDGWPLYPHHARAIAAVLLLDSWPPTWPLANRRQLGEMLELRIGAYAEFEPGMRIELAGDGYHVPTGTVVESRDGIVRFRLDRQSPKESDKR